MRSTPPPISRCAKRTCSGLTAYPQVGSPVDRDDHDMRGPLRRPCPADDVIGGRVGQIGQQVDAGPTRGSGPAWRDPAGGRPAREDHHAAAAGHRDGRRPPGLTGVTPGAHRAQPGSGPGVQGVLQPPAAEIEYVVVRQRAGIGPGRGQARNVTRTHPVVNSLARREVAAPGDAGLQVDHPDIRRGSLQDRQRIPPGPGKARRPRDPAMGPLRQADVRPRITGVSLPQFRIARVRQNLVHAAASHHVTAQEQGQQPIAHLTHCARPPAARRNRRPARTAPFTLLNTPDNLIPARPPGAAPGIPQPLRTGGSRTS